LGEPNDASGTAGHHAVLQPSRILVQIPRHLPDSLHMETSCAAMSVRSVAAVTLGR
jgi:hypothetical protein